MPESPPAPLETAQPSLLEGEHFPTNNKSSETAEITGKLGEKYNQFGMRELARELAGEEVDRKAGTGEGKSRSWRGWVAGVVGFGDMGGPPYS